MKPLFIFLIFLQTAFLSSNFNFIAPQNEVEKESIAKEMNAQKNNPKFSKSRIDLMREMSEVDQKATGVSRLNDAQIAALSKWIERYCTEFEVRKERVIQKKDPHAIAAILGDGRYVKMADGTVWNVSPNGWIYTYFWKAGEIVEATPGADTLFPITLVNQSYPLTVNAKKAAKHITNSFRNELSITDISSDGKFLTLSNGSRWEIPSSARYMVAGWSDGNSMFVTKVTKASGEHYELFNGVTARSVYAKMLTAGRQSPRLKRAKAYKVLCTKQTSCSNESNNTPQQNTN